MDWVKYENIFLEFTRLIKKMLFNVIPAEAGIQ